MGGMGEQAQTTTLNDVFITRTTPSLSPTLNPTEVPTTVPTFTPTFLPTASPTGTPSQSPTASPTGTPSQSPTELPSQSPTASPTGTPTQTPSQSPSKSPTPTPTASPTNMPTLSPTRVCGPYVNDVQDLVFKGVGSHCRDGLNTSWPGGLSCDSPYVVCLPSENTISEFGGEPYKSATHRYSVDECLQECANDQRCLG